MPLPKLNVPVHTFEVPSTKKPIKLRPMKVSDDKLLLMAKESGNPNEIFTQVRQVINNCVIDEKFDIDTLALFDIDYLFVKLRSISIGKDIEVVYLDHDDKKEYTVTIDLDKVKVKMEKVDNKIKIDDKRGLLLKYPSAKIYDSDVFKKDEATGQELFDELVVGVLDKYYEEENFTNFKDHHPKEIREFVNDLDLKTYTALKEFISALPTLYHEAKYENSLGMVKTITSTSLSDFFSF